jgi:uncharacterized OsmC-like protein
MSETIKNAPMVNGIDVDGLKDVVTEIEADPAKGKVQFNVVSSWRGQTRSETRVSGFGIGGERVARSFRFQADEPLELFGENTAPNPQEYLMGALNACMMVGYVAGAAMRGIRLDSVEIETDGELDLRGFLGIDPSVKPGYDALRYTVRIKGDDTPEQFAEIHEAVQATSPNHFNLSRPVRLEAELVVE